jgi:hypothetical protein
MEELHPFGVTAKQPEQMPSRQHASVSRGLLWLQFPGGIPKIAKFPNYLWILYSLFLECLLSFRTRTRQRFVRPTRSSQAGGNSGLEGSPHSGRSKWSDLEMHLPFFVGAVLPLFIWHTTHLLSLLWVPH